MTYRVRLHQHAVQDLDEAYRWSARSAPEAAARWLERFDAALATLAENPERCSKAPEDEQVHFEIRQLLFGRRPHVFRVLYTIDSDTVRVFRILRAQRRFLTRRQIEDAAENGE